MLKLRPKETASMLTTDSLRLDADIYRPDAEGEFPVLLMRQPYGRAIDAKIITLTVSCGGNRPSQILLPIVD